MAEEKRYWWLQMEHDFFEQKEMKALKRMSAGYVYTTIYLKILLKSLKNNGSLYFESIEDDFISEIAFDIDEAVDDVGVVFDFLKRKGLLIEVSEDEISLPGAVQRIGSKTQSAVRKARQRERERQVNNVTKSRQSVTMSQDSHVEKRTKENKINIEQLQLEQEAVAVAGKSPIGQKLKEAFGEMSISGTIVQEVEDLLATYGQTLVLHALDETILNAGKSIRYTRRILENWQGLGLRTVEQVEANRRNYTAKNGNQRDRDWFQKLLPDEGAEF